MKSSVSLSYDVLRKCRVLECKDLAYMNQTARLTTTAAEHVLREPQAHPDDYYLSV
jgi:hypothetical protein